MFYLIIGFSLLLLISAAATVAVFIAKSKSIPCGPVNEHMVADAPEEYHRVVEKGVVEKGQGPIIGFPYCQKPINELFKDVDYLMLSAQYWKSSPEGTLVWRELQLARGFLLNALEASTAPNVVFNHNLVGREKLASEHGYSGELTQGYSSLYTKCKDLIFELRTRKQDYFTSIHVTNCKAHLEHALIWMELIITSK